MKKNYTLYNAKIFCIEKKIKNSMFIILFLGFSLNNNFYAQYLGDENKIDTVDLDDVNDGILYTDKCSLSILESKFDDAFREPNTIIVRCLQDH